MSSFPRLLFEDIAPGRDFHAALLEAGRMQGPGSTLHSHDFYEMMYVLDGNALHRINGETHPMQCGDLIFIRPDDCHAMRGRTSGRAFFINIAFPAKTWHIFRDLFNLNGLCLSDEGGIRAPVAHVASVHQDECGQVFHRALRAYHESTSAVTARMELCNLWANSLPLLARKESPASLAADTMPGWLADACHRMQTDANLRAGLPRFIEVSHVSSAHLSRTLKVYCGQTPTEFINELRLKRAATLLATTPHEIINIAYDCGFENLSYFYRRFRSKFGKPPHAYRLAARHSIAP
ncbi:MAG TPA: AraC family transcriptional regulator [Capsulimonadaceae bacterium]|nr:AraC family transcriptional regulator [Capsulimonadaceae bacterium]